MGDIPIYNLTTLCLNGTLPDVDFMDVIMGDIPIHNLTTLCLNGTLPCSAFSRIWSGSFREVSISLTQWRVIKPNKQCQH